MNEAELENRILNARRIKKEMTAENLVEIMGHPDFIYQDIVDSSVKYYVYERNYDSNAYIEFVVKNGDVQEIYN